jgi:ATP-dependent RNA helicase DDX27
MAPDDFIMTIESDDEDMPPQKLSKAAKLHPEDAQLNPEFIFDLAGDSYAHILDESNFHDLVKKGSRPVSTFNIEM